MPTPERPENQAELFRRLAGEYDQTIRRYQVSYDAMLDLSTDLARVAAPGTARCLDFGTGTGEALPRLAAHFDEVVAIDPAKPMLEIARARLRPGAAGPSAGRVTFIEGTLESDEAKALPAESFDAVHCSLVLMFVKDDPGKRGVLEFLHRLLRPGGALVMTDIVVSDDGTVEARRFERWRALMRLRGADDEFVAAGERQVHATMHRRTAAQLSSLLAQAGFRDVEHPFQALHTAVLLARR